METRVVYDIIAHLHQKIIHEHNTKPTFKRKSLI